MLLFGNTAMQISLKGDGVASGFHLKIVVLKHCTDVLHLKHHFESDFYTEPKPISRDKLMQLFTWDTFLKLEFVKLKI